MILQEIKCPNCRADINLDIDKGMSFCPYCGTKLYCEDSVISSIVSEKEETKRTIIRETEKTTRQRNVLDYSENKERKKIWWGVIVPMLLLLVMAIIIQITGELEDRPHKLRGEINPGQSSDSFIGQDYEDVATYLANQGFINIKVAGSGDLIIGVLHKEGEVKKVSIDGNVDFSAYSWFSPGAKVVITYYSKSPSLQDYSG